MGVGTVVECVGEGLGDRGKEGEEGRSYFFYGSFFLIFIIAIFADFFLLFCCCYCNVSHRMCTGLWFACVLHSPYYSIATETALVARDYLCALVGCAAVFHALHLLALVCCIDQDFHILCCTVLYCNVM